MPNDSIRAGRWSGPRWIQTLSTSIRPPRSPSSDQRRPAAIAASPLHQVTSRDLAVLEEGRAHLEPDPPHEPEVARAGPTRSPARRRSRRPAGNGRRRRGAGVRVSSMSASRTRRRAANVRPTVGNGQRRIEHQRTSRSKSSSRQAAGSSQRPVCTSDGWTIVLDGATSQWNRAVVSSAAIGPALGVAGGDALDRREMPSRGLEVDDRPRARRARSSSSARPRTDEVERPAEDDDADVDRSPRSMSGTSRRTA